MNPAAATKDGEALFLEELIAQGLFLPTGEDGIYGRGAVFEEVRGRVDDLITRAFAGERPERPHFPPIMPKRILERVGYLRTFPQLCGAIFSFSGNGGAALQVAERAERGEDWGAYLTMTETVLVPAACYPSYPAIALRGRLPAGGVSLDLGPSYVFRHEPSGNPARLQMFHQRELVRIGEPDEVLAWRDTWMSRARSIFAEAGLTASLEPASDPFFGRSGKLMAASQREQRLKLEGLVQIASPEPTAVASFNSHQEHFGSVFGIQLHDGKTAHSACVGFGLERLTLALFHTHGMDIRGWPREVRRRLWPGSGAPGTVA